MKEKMKKRAKSTEQTWIASIFIKYYEGGFITQPKAAATPKVVALWLIA
jgi:hypothetical protein